MVGRRAPARRHARVRGDPARRLPVPLGARLPVDRHARARALAARLLLLRHLHREGARGADARPPGPDPAGRRAVSCSPRSSASGSRARSGSSRPGRPGCRRTDVPEASSTSVEVLAVAGAVVPSSCCSPTSPTRAPARRPPSPGARAVRRELRQLPRRRRRWRHRTAARRRGRGQALPRRSTTRSRSCADGSGAMPAFGGQLSPAQIRQVVEYTRTL